MGNQERDLSPIYAINLYSKQVICSFLVGMKRIKMYVFSCIFLILAIIMRKKATFLVCTKEALLPTNLACKVTFQQEYMNRDFENIEMFHFSCFNYSS